jgi:hypothetical protein
MMAESPGIGFRVWLLALLGALCMWAAPSLAPGAAPQPDVQPVAEVIDESAGDGRPATSYDGPLLRRRPAIAVHTVDGADRDLIRRELRAAAKAERFGPLADATFAVFSERLLDYLVPEVTMVLPETATVRDAEILMRDHRFTGVSYYLTESVLVHDLTFAVFPAGVPPATVKARADAEGILSDSLGDYVTDVQPAGLTVRYFGAVLGDDQTTAVRAALARLAHVRTDQVLVEPSSPGSGVRLVNGLDVEGLAEEAAHGHE